MGIGGSNEGIQLVIGLNLAYKAKRASVVWRVRITTGEDGIDDFDCVRHRWRDTFVQCSQPKKCRACQLDAHGSSISSEEWDDGIEHSQVKPTLPIRL